MLTASAIATAIDENPYETRDALIKQYAGVGRPAFNGNEATKHGEQYEDEAVRLFEQRHNKKVLTFGLMPFWSKDHLYLGGSVDGITSSGELIEVKCPYRRKPTGVVPRHYIPQVQSLLCGLDLNSAYFVEYVPESTWVSQYFCATLVERDDLFLVRHHAYLREFWFRVCLCRENTDRLCFNAPLTKRRPRKRQRKPLQINIS